MKKSASFWVLLGTVLLLMGCAQAVSVSTDVSIIEPAVLTATPAGDASADLAETQNQTGTTDSATDTATDEVGSTEQSVTSTKIPPATWQEWPVLPEVSARAKDVYLLGQQLGRDPHAFSVFGDCQSLPDVFMGMYDDSNYQLPAEFKALQDTIEWYSGSFSRESVTLKKGTTVAAILWEGWVDDDNAQCEFGETPLECEIRLHNPSIVIINLGTHWELRNGLYLRKIIETLLEQGIVPIISTKADSREGEGWVNEELVAIANEYEVPVWNFWLAAQETENGGMKMNDPMYLNDEGLEIHRLSGLQALDAVLRALNTP